MEPAGKIVDGTDPGWLAFVLSRREATLFQHPAWLTLLASVYGYRARVLLQTDVAGEIHAGMPLLEVASPFTGRGLISLPFTDHCPPLAEDEASLIQLGAGLQRWSATLPRHRVEVRTALPEWVGFSRAVAGVRHVLALESDSTAILERLSSPVARALRKAKREGLEVRIDASPQAVRHFYRLHWATRRRQGVPVQPKRFFDALSTDILQPGYGFVALAWFQGEPIAGAVFLAWNRTLIYKFGASDKRHLSLRANNLVMWAGIEWGCKMGYASLDLGKTDLDNQGLRTYKNRWTATELPLEYSYRGQVRSAGQHSKLQGVMGKVIRWSPPLVCRALGELLYAHFP